MVRLFLPLIILVSKLLGSGPIVGAYYENWSQYRPGVGGRPQFFPNLIDPTVITDLYYAFACFGFVSKSIDPTDPHLTGDYTVQPIEWNDQTVLYPQVQALKKINPNLRTLLSIGGWSFNDPTDPMGQYTFQLFSKMVSSESNRSQFIQSAVSYAKQYGFNGIDIDWESPGDLTRGGTLDDFSNFVQFLQECYEACHAQDLLLTYASTAIVPAGVPQEYKDHPALYFQWLGKCSAYLDRFNLMAYDYHGSFDNPKLTGVNAPLNQDTNPTSTLYLVETLNNYITNGVPANKIVLGMPTYGHSFGRVEGISVTVNGPGLPFSSAGDPGPATQTPGFLAYFEIADRVALKTLTFGTDTLTSTSYGYNVPAAEWVSFDTPDTIALKVDLAIKMGLLGGMFWSVDDDEYHWAPTYPNIRKGYTLFNSPYAHRQPSGLFESYR